MHGVVFHRAIVVAALVLSLPYSGAAAGGTDEPAGAGFMLGGQVRHPQHWATPDLQTMPPTSVQISFATDAGSEAATYTGVLLWTLLANAQPIDGPGKGARLRHVVSVTGRDGYSIMLAEAELDPDFEGKTILLAYEKNGKPLGSEAGIRLIVPGDRRGGRVVRDVARIDIQ